MDVTVTLTQEEVLILAICLNTAPPAPPLIEGVINSIAQKILDAQDLAML